MRIYAPPPLMKNTGLIRVHRTLLPPPPPYVLTATRVAIATVSLPPAPLPKPPSSKLPKETGTYMFRGATGSVPTWEFVIRDTR
uniref:Uncharacterized protein n=1 Tax=viral metagenome TaxID=1070528 RepID=A0A6C0K1E7_9ZZZZ